MANTHLVPCTCTVAVSVSPLTSVAVKSTFQSNVLEALPISVKYVELIASGGAFGSTTSLTVIDTT